MGPRSAPSSLWRLGALGSTLLLASGVLLSLQAELSLAAKPAPDRQPDLLLVTLDTTRADALGCYGGKASTPNLDQIAREGVRFASAWSASPLTLPAHATLMSGLEPGDHGLRDNGWGRLGGNTRVLAEVLRQAGYATAGFPASEVLDRRFGLDRGFDTYNDSFTAERTGQYGYPERSAAEGVSAVLSWLGKAPAEAPWFVWWHIYDPHAPYLAPGADDRSRYEAEISAADAELGRLLAAWPPSRRRVVAVVGDHGEAFGEHGESGHGLFLYRPTLEVPLLLAGPGLPRGKVVRSAVATRRLAATLVNLVATETSLPGPTLPTSDSNESAKPIFHETLFPATAYGWHPLAAVTQGSLRVIAAPRAEVYDLASDAQEVRSLLSNPPSAARRLTRLLREQQAAFPATLESASPVDPEVAATLRGLGYLSGQSRKVGTLDPKDGVLLLADFEAAERELERGAVAAGLSKLRTLVERSPESVPFLSRLAAAERQAGERVKALETLDRALKANPQLDVLHLERGEVLSELRRTTEAVAAFELVLMLHPRSATAWLRLAELELRAGRSAQEESLLQEALAVGTKSALIHARLAEIALGRNEVEIADQHLAQATSLLPEWPTAWKMWAEVARRQGRGDLADKRNRRAASL